MKDERPKTDPARSAAVPPADAKATPERFAFPWRVVGGGGLALLLIWFVLQNSHSVRVNLFWWSGNFPMILLMAAVAIAAIVVWEALALVRRRRKRNKAGAER